MSQTGVQEGTADVVGFVECGGFLIQMRWVSVLPKTRVDRPFLSLLQLTLPGFLQLSSFIEVGEDGKAGFCSVQNLSGISP